MSLRSIVAVTLHAAAGLTSFVALILAYALSHRSHESLGKGLYGLAVSTALNLYGAWTYHHYGFPTVLRAVLDRQPTIELLVMWMCTSGLTRLADVEKNGEDVKLGAWVYAMMSVVMWWAMAKAVGIWMLQIYGWREWWILHLVRAALGRRSQTAGNGMESTQERSGGKGQSYAVKRWLHEAPAYAEEKDAANPQLSAAKE